LLLANRAAGEVGLAEDAGGVCGVAELDALVEALCLVMILKARSAYMVSKAYAATWGRKYLLLDSVDEVELDTLGWHLEDGGRLAIIFVELRVCLIAIVVCDLNDAVVLKTTLKSSFSCLCLSRLANVNSAAETRGLEQPSVHLAEVMVNVQRTHPVAGLDTSRVATWRVSKRRVEAVSVPVLAAVVASNNDTLSEGRLVASITKDVVALAVLEFVVIRSLVVSATARLYTSAKRARQTWGRSCELTESWA